ncbi:MAG: preprotein translocase subunit SecA [Rickettsiales bacterium]
MGLLTGIFGNFSDSFVKKCRADVHRVNALSEPMAALSDDALRGKTTEFRERLKKKETLDDLLPEAFAVAREAAFRAMKMRHYDVQLIGGMALHKGMIAEMRTGEGKTLMATLPVYLNALSGKGVHVVTVNDYLAQRDAEWMGRVYRFLGLTVGCIVGGMHDGARRDAYAADVTYGTNNEYGFDYLRDNMKFRREDMVQRAPNYAIVDEIDSILIDEARTPLIISGQAENNPELYTKVNAIIPRLVKDDYEIEEKHRNVTLTDKGGDHVEELLRGAGVLDASSGVYDVGHIAVMHHVGQALTAHKIYQKDKDYIVKDGKIVIIDEFTGRMMEDRRYSDGLHQALEAKESVRIRHENQTLASITFQNYFRMYQKLSGMTGTARTEEKEFGEIYGLRVVDVPSNKAPRREDEDDAIYRTLKEKNDALLRVIKECHEKGRPALVGTVSIEKSELLSAELRKHNVPHEVLNAKQHLREAFIIAQAGRPGAVTIATNMAGRGTDIMLGGNAEMLFKEETAGQELTEEQAAARLAEIEAKVAQDKQKALEAGGLFVVGTERHESRRIDNQLRGRSGRQGDPGRSKFFLSLEDDLMRIFGSDKLRDSAFLRGLEEGEVLTHPWLSRVIAKAQQRVERHHFDVRKNLLRFDSVMNEQRKAVYEQRRALIDSDDVTEAANDMAEDVIESLVAAHIPERSYAEDWDAEGLEREAHRITGLHLPVAEWAKEDGVAEEQITERLVQAWQRLLQTKAARTSPDVMRLAQKKVLLVTLDQVWKEHLLALDHLKQGISLRAYGQKDPLGEYKREAFTLFEEMTANLRETAVTRISHIEVSEEDRKFMTDFSEFDGGKKSFIGASEDGSPTFSADVTEGSFPFGAPFPFAEDDDGSAERAHVGRNDPCPCGSAKKFKHCHGSFVAKAGGAGR